MLFIWLALVSFNSILYINTLNLYSENSNSCVDSCSNGFSSVYKVNLENGNYELKDNEVVEILETGGGSDELGEIECSRNVLLRIPFLKLSNGTIVRIELEYGDLARGTTFHIGNSPTNDLNGGDRNTTMYNSEIYANETNLSYYMSSVNLCDQDVAQDDSIDLSRLLFLNESSSFLNPKSKLVIYVSEKWFRIDSLERNTSFYYNNDYLFTFHRSELSEKCQKSVLNQSPYNKISPFLYIGLNRVVADAKFLPGSGLCNADVSFLNCYMNSQPDVDINVNEMKSYLIDSENIAWVNPLSYLEPSLMEHPACSAQGVLKVKFDPNSNRKVARFDLEFGEELSGFTFNIGDSPTNNAYGGDSGTTSNSAEIHSNDNRFYVWLNTKYCGDTLLYKIEYNLFQSYDKLSLFISDQRIEITNHRGYHEILRSPYLYNLNRQNVTCNCFDTRCYSGVNPDDDIYFGINRVIGGTYRPGVGLCNARISWLKCQNDFKLENPVIDSDYIDLFTKTTLTESVKSTTTATTTTTTDYSTSTPVINLITTTLSLSVESSSIETTTMSTSSVSSTSASLTTLDILNVLRNSSSLQSYETLKEDTADDNEDQEDVDEEDEGTVGRIIKGSKLGRFDKGKPLLIRQNVTLIGPSSEPPEQEVSRTITNQKQENLDSFCNEENFKNDLIYHEYKLDSTKFIFCEGVNKSTILTCPLNMKWSQSYQQCLQEI